MDEIRLSDFVEFLDGSGRRYCIVNQEKIGDRHFAYALPVPETSEEIGNAELVILEFAILENGEIGVREYSKAQKDYQEIKNIMSELTLDRKHGDNYS